MLCMITYTALWYPYHDAIRTVSHASSFVLTNHKKNGVAYPDPLSEEDYKSLNEDADWVMFLYNGARIITLGTLAYLAVIVVLGLLFGPRY